MRSICPRILCVAALSFAASVPTVSFAQQAGALITQQWKSVGENGVLKAGVLPPFGAAAGEGGRVSVSVTGNDGRMIAGVPTNDSSTEMTFRGVRPGTYSLLATGPDLVALYAVHVVGETTVGTERPLLVAPANLDLAIVQNAATRYLPDEVDFSAVFAAAVGTEIVKRQEVTGIQAPRIRLSGDRLQGQLYRAGAAGPEMVAAGANNIQIFKDQVLVKQLISDADGRFEVAQLLPGAYSIVIAGPDGMAVTGFDVAENRLTTAQSEASAASESAIRYVTQPAGGTQDSFAVQLAPVGKASPTIEQLFRAPASGGDDAGLAGVPADQLQAMSGGGGGGGGGGGLGGLGGSAGLGPILGLGGIGAAAAIAASDDDDTLVPPPIASPITP